MADENSRSVDGEAQTAVRESTFAAIGRWLEANEWTYQEYPDKGYYAMHFSGQHGSWRVIVDLSASETLERVVIYSIYPIFVPELKRQEVSELLTRANYGMTIGGFEMDFEDGVVRMKTASEIDKGVFSDEVFGQLFAVNLSVAGRYLSAIYGVAFGNLAPNVAVQIAEKPDRSAMQ